MSVYRKPTNTDCYVDWHPNHPISAKKAGSHDLISRAKNVFSTPGILAKEMDCLHRALLTNNYPDWLIKKT